MQLEKNRDYSLQQIIKSVGLPVIVKKTSWSDNFCFRVERVSNSVAYGTALKNGVEHQRRFGGGYTYGLNELFRFVKGIEESDSAKIEEQKKRAAEEAARRRANEEELLNTKAESESVIEKINPSLILRVSGSIKDKAFRPVLSVIRDKAAVVEDEKKNAERIIYYIKELIKKLAQSFLNPQKPSWFDRETGPKGTLQSAEGEEYLQAIKKNEEIENTITDLLESQENPYFYHLQLQYEDEQKPADVFVGERLVEDKELDKDPIVVSWQSELGNLAYDKDKTRIQVKDGTWADIFFRREVLIKGGRVNDAVETFNKDQALADEVRTMVYDSFLLKVLESKRERHELTNIIPSIQRNQYEIIRAPLRDSLVVQGCAGCGKTMILLHRISYLLYNNKNYRQQDYLILSPSKQFNKHIQPLLRDLRLESVFVRSVPEYYVELLRDYNPEWRELDGDERLFSDAMAPQGFEYLYSEEYVNLLRSRCPAKIKAIQDNERAISRLAEERKEQRDRNNDVSAITSEIERRKRLRRISIFDEEFADILPAGVKAGNRKRPVCKAELFATLLLYYLCYGSKRGFRIVCIDEGQDLARSEYEIIRSLNSGAVLNIYGDLDQRVNPQGLKAWEELNSVSSFYRYRINENYRNTEQITDFVNDELMKDMKGLGLNGPEVKMCSESQLVHERLIAPKDRKAIVFKDPTFMKRISINLAGYEVFSVSEVKGMEFETVFVVPNGMSDNEQYVAYTRALNRLFLLNL